MAKKLKTKFYKYKKHEYGKKNYQIIVNKNNQIFTNSDSIMQKSFKNIKKILLDKSLNLEQKQMEFELLNNAFSTKQNNKNFIFNEAILINDKLLQQINSTSELYKFLLESDNCRFESLSVEKKQAINFFLAIFYKISFYKETLLINDFGAHFVLDF